MKTYLRIKRRAQPKGNVEELALAKDPNIRVQPLDGDPVPAIIVAVGASFGAMLLSNLLESAAEGVVRPVTGGIEYLSKVETAKLYGDTIATTLLDATLSPVLIDEAGDGAYVNITDTTIKDVFKKVAEATAMASALLSEDAGEIAMESLQEAFSNAVYYGLGGAYATWSAYRVGLTPPNDFMTGPETLLLDNITRANLDALVGQNVYTTTAQEVARLAGQILDTYAKADKVDALLRLFANAGDPLLPLMAGLARQYETVGDYLVELIRAHLAVLQRRVVDAIDEVRAAWADYNAGLITETEMRTILVDAMLEMKEIMNTAEDILTTVEEVIGEIIGLSDADLANVASIIDKLERALDSYWMQMSDQLQGYINTLKFARRRIKSIGLTWRAAFRKLGIEVDYTW